MNTQILLPSSYCYVCSKSIENHENNKFCATDVDTKFVN